MPAEPAPEPARGRSWVWPAKPDQVPTPFDQRISETAGEVDAAQSAWEQSVEAVFAARDDFAGATAAQPLDPRQLERARRAYQEARARQSDAGSKLQRARVRLQVLENARSRWTVAQW